MRKSPSLSSNSPAALRRKRRELNQEAGLRKVKSVDTTSGYPTEGSFLIQNSPGEYGRQLKPAYVKKMSSMFAPSEEPPELSHWIVPALLCALAYALYNIFIKKGSASIHPILGGVILQFVAAIIGLILCVFLAYGPTQEEMFYDSNGIFYAVLAGASVGMAEIISFTVSGMGVQATQSIPIIIG